MEKYWETASDDMIELMFRREIDEIFGDIRKKVLATRGDAIEVFRKERAMIETGQWPKWPEEKYYEDWVSIWEDFPESSIEHLYGHEVDEILKAMRIVKPDATRNDAIEECRKDHTNKAMEAFDEVQRNKQRNDPATSAQRQAAIYAVMANKKNRWR